MILYLDSSALVKRYISEVGSDAVADAIAQAEIVGTSLISRAETVAALAKAARLGVLKLDDAEAAVPVFRSGWPIQVRVQATEALMGRADSLAWELGLRGYDAVQLASALIWQESMEQQVVFATFDRRLWRAGTQQGLKSLPMDLVD